MDQFQDANVRLTLMGHIVYTVATSVKGDFQPTVDQKIMLDMVHLKKIDESEAVVVVGLQEDGSYYIGESTRKEIAYARASGKEVVFYRGDDEFTGPVRDFEKDLKIASKTKAMIEAEEEAREAQKKAWIDSLRSNLSDGHTGLPDCPACNESDEEKPNAPN
jgi:hypothetical protein